MSIAHKNHAKAYIEVFRSCSTLLNIYQLGQMFLSNILCKTMFHSYFSQSLKYYDILDNFKAFLKCLIQIQSNLFPEKLQIWQFCSTVSVLHVRYRPKIDIKNLSVLVGDISSDRIYIYDKTVLVLETWIVIKNV